MLYFKIKKEMIDISFNSIINKLNEYKIYNFIAHFKTIENNKLIFYTSYIKYNSNRFLLSGFSINKIKKI
jgi:hypothetical protein